MLSKDTIRLGSGGGCVTYPLEAFACAQKETAYSEGSAGGGALYLEIDGNLVLGHHTKIHAKGNDAKKHTGGAGSGGSLCIADKEIYKDRP